VKEGDELAYEIEKGRVVLTKAPRRLPRKGVPFEDPFAAFLEWDSKEDEEGSSGSNSSSSNNRVDKADTIERMRKILERGTGFTAAVDEFTGEITGDAANTVLTPGNGVFVRVDAPTTVTFVGEVPAGSLSNPIPKGFSIKASQVPQAGKVTTDLGFTTASAGDQIFVFDTAANKYNTSTVDEFTGTWDTEPTLDVGQAAFFRVDAAKAWTRSFDISK